MKQKKLQSKVCKDLLYFVHPAALIYTFKQSRHENIFASMTISESEMYLAEQSLQNHCSIPKISHFGDQNLKATLWHVLRNVTILKALIFIPVPLSHCTGFLYKSKDDCRPKLTAFQQKRLAVGYSLHCLCN